MYNVSMVQIDWGMYMSIIGLGARQGGGAGPTWLKVCLRRDVSTYVSFGTWVYAKSYLLDIWGLWEHLLGAVMA